MRIFTIYLLFLIGPAVNGQSIPETKNTKKYAPEELQEDYLVLRKALETTYPSLYRFTDSLTITKYLDNQLRRLDRSMTELEFYKIVAPTCARANDEHLIPTPSKNYYRSLEDANHYFPFSLKIIDRRFYVLKNASSNIKIPIGAEILSINGHTAEEILNMLLPTIPSDGYIQTFNIRHLEDYSMTQMENLFDLNYPIFIEDADSFRIDFIRPENKSQIETLTIQGIDYKTYKEFHKERIGYRAPLEFKYLKNDIAYLRIASFLKWHRNDFRQDFYSLYDSIFKALKQKETKNLILDLRNNEGGDGTGEKLITYLLTKPYRHLSFIEEKFTGYPPVADYLESGKDLFFIDSIVYRTPDTGMYRLKKEYYHYSTLFNEQSPNQNSYSGKLFVLINGASGSMASIVSSFLRHNTSATFIGEESGGTMEGNTSDAVRLKLPNTEIRIDIPLTKKVHHVNFEKGRGVYPHYHVVPNIEDILIGEDTELNFTLELISSEN